MAQIILFLSIINFLLTLFVFLNVRKEKQHISFLVFSLIATIWIFNNFLLRIYPYGIHWSLSFGLGILMPTSVLIWVCHFLREKISSFISFFIIPASILMFFLSSFTNYVVYPIDAITTFGYESKMGPLFILYSVYLAFLIIFVLYKLLKNLLKKEEEEKDIFKKQQILSLLIGGILFGSFAFIVDFLIPLLFDTFKFTELVSITYLPLLLFIVYSITRHQLFGIKIMLTQLLVAVFLALLLLRFLFSFSYSDYTWNGVIMAFSFIIGYLIIKSVYKEVATERKLFETERKLFKKTKKELVEERTLHEVFEEIAEERARQAHDLFMKDEHLENLKLKIKILNLAREKKELEKELEKKERKIQRLGRELKK